MKIDPNEPAFPFPHRTLVDPYDPGKTETLRKANLGLTIRAELAARFMAAIINKHTPREGISILEVQERAAGIAVAAAINADALIAELNKEQP